MRAADALPFEYGDPPACRETGCTAWPTWEAMTADGDEGETFADYLCGRHLQTFLWEQMWKAGEWVTLTRRKKQP